MLKGRHLIDPMDFTIEEFEEIFNYADEIIKSPEKFSHICDGKF